MKMHHHCIIVSNQEHTCSSISYTDREGWYGLPQGCCRLHMAGHITQVFELLDDGINYVYHMYWKI